MKHEPRFDGPEYVPERDWDRLTTQLGRIKALMEDGRWRTLAEISEGTGDPAASISAQLRHLRKERFGSYRVERQQRGEGGGTFEYRVLPPDPDQPPPRRKVSELDRLRAENARLRGRVAVLEMKLSKLQPGQMGLFTETT